MSASIDDQSRRAVIGNEKNFWLHSPKTGFDLTHPAKPSSRPVKPSVTIQTSTSPITIDPAKTALVVIDMQRFFLSPAFGRSRGPGHDALDQLVAHAIPAARKAGIRIVWLNWGLTDQDIQDMPPAVTRAFGFEAIDESDLHDGKVFEARGSGQAVNKHGEASFAGGDKILENGKTPRSVSKGLGSECGLVVDPETGNQVDAGRMLMMGSWNAALQAPLDKLFEEGRHLKTRPDVWLHKNRMSGMAGEKTLCEEFLEQEGIRTLLFTGVNTDQCVGGTLTDSFSKGYDCVMLDDGCGTSSPNYAQQCFQFNAANTFGFLATCRAFNEGVAAMQM